MSEQIVENNFDEWLKSDHHCHCSSCVEIAKAGYEAGQQNPQLDPLTQVLLTWNGKAWCSPNGKEWSAGVVTQPPPGKPKDFPQIVCLCGSTRFWRQFQKSGLDETMAGRIVLSIGAASGTDDDHFGNLPREEYDRVKTMLDELHKRKIDLADEVLILNVGGYIGDSTRSELDYAIAHGKPVRYLEHLPTVERDEDDALANRLADLSGVRKDHLWRFHFCCGVKTALEHSRAKGRP